MNSWKKKGWFTKSSTPAVEPQKTEVPPPPVKPDESPEIVAAKSSGSYPAKPKEAKAPELAARVPDWCHKNDDVKLWYKIVSGENHPGWKRRLPCVVKDFEAVKIDNLDYTIVGVAPKDFFGTTVGSAPDLWVSLAMEKQMPPAHWDTRTDPAAQSLYLISRLRDGVSAEQASPAINLLYKQWLGTLESRLPAEKKQQFIQKASIELTPASRGLSSLREQFSLSLKDDS